MFSWMAPFAVLLVVVALYFASRGTPRQAAMMKDINFYIVCVMAVSIVSIIAGARYGEDWLDTGAWIAAALASAAAVWQWKQASEKK